MKNIQACTCGCYECRYGDDHCVDCPEARFDQDFPVDWLDSTEKHD